MKSKSKVVIFCDNSIWTASILLEAVKSEVNARKDFECVALITPEHPLAPAMLLKLLRAKVSWLIRKYLFRSAHLSKSSPNNIYFHARAMGARVVSPKNTDVNDPEFINSIKSRFSPDVLLVFKYGQKFSAELLDIFSQKINFHNGTLPAYRGVKATGWSIYNREQKSGYCFHHMTEELDAGRILIQNEINIEQSDTPFSLMIQKSLKASQDVAKLFRLIEEQKPGAPQMGKPGYYSSKQYFEIIKIDNYSTISSDELLHILRAFGKLNLKIEGHYREVKHLIVVNSKKPMLSRCCFNTVEGDTICIPLFSFLPKYIQEKMYG